MAGKREEEQLKEITERLEQGVKELFTSEKYTEYLKIMSQFRNYSFNNTLLIAIQKPESTLVAGHATWDKKFHRQVKRGEKGIRIIAPVPVREKEEIEKFDPETNEPVLRPDGQPETEVVERTVPRFRVSTVYDISQTLGEPLPEPGMPELMGSEENFDIFMEAARMVSPVPIRYAETNRDSKGYYSNADKEIVIREGMGGKLTMKTAVHEMAHAMCHDRDVMEELGEKKNRMTIETESVAFTVCSFFGLDTSDYSFPYLAGWAGSTETEELRSSMDFIRKTAGSFIDGMVENIQKLQKEKAAERELTEDDLVFQFAPPGEDTKKFYLVDNVGRADFLRLLHDFADQHGENKNPEQFLKSHGVHMDLWRDSEDAERKQEMPGFYDVLYMDADHIVDAAASPILVQVEMMASRAEYGHVPMGKEAHNLAVLYAYKLDDPRKTRALANKLAKAAENPGAYNIREIMEEAQAEIDFLPDSQVGLMQMHEYGYRNDFILPLKMERAVALHKAGLHIYSLNKDGSRTLMDTREDISEMGADGMFGVEDREWDNYLMMESAREGNGNAEQEHLNEDLLFGSSQDRYAIYQIRDDGQGRKYLFMGTEYLKKHGFSVGYDDYRMVYSDVLGGKETLDSLYEKFNIRRPLDFKGHSLSVSDVVAMKRDGEITAHYVDSFGYTELPEFFSQRERSREQGKEERAENHIQEEKVYPPLYTHTLAYAIEHGRAGDYRESKKLNLDCKKAIEDAVRKNFDGMRLAHGTAQGVLEEYGAERVVFVLANTVQRLEHDGRFSAGNKAWAKGYEIPENVNRGTDMNADYVLSSHPAILDGFIGLVRDGIQEQELENGENMQVNEGTKGFIVNGHFGTWHTAEGREISGEMFYRMEHEGYGDSVASIIVSQDGKLVAEDLEHGFDQGAMEAIGGYFSAKGMQMEPAQKAKEYLDHHGAEAAYQTENGYFSIQTVSGGYDYTVYGKDFREIDGGVYDNPNLSISEAMEVILSDEGIPVATCKVIDYEELQEKTGTAAQEELQKAQEKEKLPLISDMTEPEPALNGQSRAGIEETVLCYAQARIDEMGLSEEVELLGARVYGSRSREGLYHESSDIDVAVSYSGGLKEDIFLDALHGDGLKIAGIPVDIHPVSAEKTGTLEEYLEGAEKYLDEKQSHRETAEKAGEPAREAAVTFYVAECTEFPALGEYHEGLKTLQEAMELYEKIPAERMNGMKGIGFCLEDGSSYGGKFDLMVMGEMQTEFINEIPQYRESTLVQKAVADMEAILSKRVERNAPEPIRLHEDALKTDKGISGGSKKHSVLNSLRKRQARMKAQGKENQGQAKQRQKAQPKKKGEQEL